jgi:TolB-like protein
MEEKMIGKKAFLCALMALLSVEVFSQSMTLDEAIRTTATEAGQRISGNRLPNVSFSNQSIEQTADEIRKQLTAQTKIAVLNFSSNWQELSAYVIDELNNAIVRNSSLTVVDRQQLDLVRQEQNFQMSGDVDDKSAQSIGKFLGAQSVLSGSFTIIGKTNRFRIKVIDVETGVQQYGISINIKKDSILTALMPQRPPEYTTITRDYNFGERLGIGFLNIFFGLGSLAYDDKDWGFWLGVGQFASMGIGAFTGSMFLLADYEPWWEPIVIGAGIGAGIVGTIGFIRAFFIHTSKRDRIRVSSLPQLNLDLVAVSSSKMGIQISYKWHL